MPRWLSRFFRLAQEHLEPSLTIAPLPDGRIVVFGNQATVAVGSFGKQGLTTMYAFVVEPCDGALRLRGPGKPDELVAIYGPVVESKPRMTNDRTS